MLLELASKVLPRGEIQHGAWGRDIGLNEHDAPGAVKHAQRKAALGARDLVVIELHGVDGAAAELVILRVGTKYRRQQDARALALWMGGELFSSFLSSMDLHL